MNINLGKTILIIGAVVLAGLVGFAAGRRFTIRRNVAVNFPTGPGMMRGWGRGVPPANLGRNGFRNTLRGQITAVNGNTVTVLMPYGANQTIDITTNTQISNASNGSQQDLQNGKTIAITGVRNSDGSINAQTILVNPPSPTTTPAPAK